MNGGKRKPRFFGYATYAEASDAWAFFQETQVVPFSPVDGGVSATSVPSTQPMTPQRNNRSSSYRSSPTLGSPSRATLTSSPLLPGYSPLSPLQQPHTTVPKFFVVVVGLNPGVFSSL